tara:strand:+ start:116 stop:346 length:231 start_codon:yes stop_codon:yes gene_type:complete
MFEDDLGPDDELIPKPLDGLFGANPLSELEESAQRLTKSARINQEIQDCTLPHGSFERLEFLNKKIKELVNEVRGK